MTNPLTRRTFLSSTLAVGAAAASGCQLPFKQKGRLRHAGIAIGGMGASDLSQIAKHPAVDIVAICDIDTDRLNKVAKNHPQARAYQDWRELLRKERGWVDSVHISCPDHMHAPIAMQAMHQGLHVYCQKPLTHTVVEARRLAEMAEKKGLVTQMGIQNHSGNNFRQALEVFRQGLTGQVSEAHVWTDRPAGWWPQNVGRPEGEDPIPASLDWEGWLGVAPLRPFKAGAYHAFAWRGRKDFGTGAQGDMACHLMDPVPWFLEVTAPTSLQSFGPKPNHESFPEWSRVSYQFPATPHTSANGVQVTWHDGGRKPDEVLQKAGFGEKSYGNACLFIGEKGALLVSPYEPCLFVPTGGEMADLKQPKVPPINHWHQFVNACLGKGETTASFRYSGPLTEIALLGNVALHFPNQTLQWDSGAMKFPNMPEADAYLHKSYRDGWQVKGLG